MFIDFRGEVEERETPVCCSTYLCIIGWFLYVPWPRFEPATLAYVYNTVTYWAT